MACPAASDHPNENDFCPGGALAVPEGDEAACVNELAASGDYDLVVATRDWHPPDHGSFAEQGAGRGRCTASPGRTARSYTTRSIRRRSTSSSTRARIRPRRATPGFQDTPLAELLRERGVDRVTIAGLATDYCVKNTALDALREGFAVTVDSAATRGVEVQEGDSEWRWTPSARRVRAWPDAPPRSG